MGEKRILDEKTRKQLFGYVPFSTEVKVNYTPEEFDVIADVTLRPVFEVRSLTQAEQSQLKTNYRGYTSDAKPEEIDTIVEKNMAIARNCISGWSNYFDAGTGEEIEYNEEHKKQLPGWIIVKIAEFIKKISSISVPENLSLK